MHSSIRDDVSFSGALWFWGGSNASELKAWTGATLTCVLTSLCTTGWKAGKKQNYWLILNQVSRCNPQRSNNEQITLAFEFGWRKKKHFFSFFQQLPCISCVTSLILVLLSSWKHTYVFHQVYFFFFHLLLATVIQKNQNDCNLWQRRVFIRTLPYLQPHQLQAYRFKNVFYICFFPALYLNYMNKNYKNEKTCIHLLPWLFCFEQSRMNRFPLTFKKYTDHCCCTVVPGWWWSVVQHLSTKVMGI